MKRETFSRDNEDGTGHVHVLAGYVVGHAHVGGDEPHGIYSHASDRYAAVPRHHAWPWCAAYGDPTGRDFVRSVSIVGQP